MQNETSLYEIPADRMVFTHQGLGDARELGEVEIVNTMWGKARVRAVNNRGKPALFWLLAALAVGGVVATAWFLLSESEKPKSEPLMVTTPQDTAAGASGQEGLGQHIPDAHAMPPAPVPAPAAIPAPEPAIPAQPGSAKPQPSTEKQPAAEKKTTREVATESPSLRPPASADKPGRTPLAVTAPPVGTAPPSGQTKQDGQAKPADTGKAASATAPANPATASKAAPAKAESPKAELPKADSAGSAPPAKPEPSVKPDTTESLP